ncbi:hypothetical protein CYMTET_52886 [Cymbomonas tetramitiformis]|uniref:Ionotropic glutamate receptor C-terminal domain-containing protein n=1 Tax=Cymbomonas tetramitiformis TaxID=36881 RepID=A0AAE0EQW8_9CHLO|nr:hypothetical protein CYMTET_52886 [Cymbomonas tetramitiformis]
MHLHIGTWAGNFEPYWNAISQAEEPEAETGLYQISITGHVATFIDEISREMGFSYRYFRIDNLVHAQHHIDNGDLDMFLEYELRQEMYKQDVPPKPSYLYNWTYSNYSNVTWWASSTGVGTDYSLTLPLYQSPTGALGYKERSFIGLWRFMRPFTANLWWMLLFCLCSYSVLKVGLGLLHEGNAASRRTVPPPLHSCRCGGPECTSSGLHMPLPTEVPPSARRRLAIRFSSAFYHTFAVFLQGDDYNWSTVPLRILRTSILVVVLVTVATYTANLASFFTQSEYSIIGPETVADLRDSVACSVIHTNYSETLGNYVKKLINPEHCSESGWSECGRLFCHDQLRTGAADIWLDDYNGLHEYSSRHCEDLNERPAISLYPYTSRIFMLLTDQNSPLTANLSTAILFLTNQPWYLNLMDESFRLQHVCGEDDEGTEETEKVTLDSMWGLFLVAGVIAACSLLAAVDDIEDGSADDSSVQPNSYI